VVRAKFHFKETTDMIRRFLTLTASLLAIAALAPAAASAAELAGAPQLRVVDGNRVQLKFAVDEKLPVKAGKVTTKITIDGKAVKRLTRSGRHGRDFVYTARVAAGGLEVGSKYTVRFHLPGGTVVRQVKVHPARP
jgi:hypothetical protein